MLGFLTVRAYILALLPSYTGQSFQFYTDNGFGDSVRYIKIFECFEHAEARARMLAPGMHRTIDILAITIHIGDHVGMVPPVVAESAGRVPA